MAIEQVLTLRSALPEASKSVAPAKHTISTAPLGIFEEVFDGSRNRTQLDGALWLSVAGALSLRSQSFPITESQLIKEGREITMKGFAVTLIGQ